MSTGCSPQACKFYHHVRMQTVILLYMALGALSGLNYPKECGLQKSLHANEQMNTQSLPLVPEQLIRIQPNMKLSVFDIVRMLLIEIYLKPYNLYNFTKLHFKS